MGLFNIFKKPIYEKYGGLIYALKEHYQSLRITKTEASIFSMTANNCGNIDNLNITIYRGNAFDEHPTEYKNLYYDDYVFVKTTYSINGEAVAIRNAFPKNGNQFMMFTSIIGAEIMKTNYVIELQHKKEEELKKATEENEKRKKANNNEDSKTIIIQTWSLLDFAKEYGPKVHIANCSNNKTGDKFKCAVFGEEDNRTFVAFSSKLGELTAKEMIERKHQLKIKKWSKGNKEGFTLYE